MSETKRIKYKNHGLMERLLCFSGQSGQILCIEICIILFDLKIADDILNLQKI